MTRRTKILLFLIGAGFVIMADVPWTSSGEAGQNEDVLAYRAFRCSDRSRQRASAKVGVQAEVPALAMFLPVPEKLEPRARLWEAVYGEYDSTQIILYHRDRPSIIYQAVPALSGRKEQAMARLRERLSILDRITAKSSDPAAALAERPDAAELLALYHQLDGLDGPDRFAEAARPGAIGAMRGKRDGLIKAFSRANLYLPRMEKIFEARGVPRVLTRLTFVESMFDRDARSEKNAYGLWQILPEAGGPHLVMNFAVDERRDPVAGTEAAARILASNYKLLGTWPLAVTAYNAGAPRMERELRRTGSTRLVEVLDRSNHRAFGFCVNNFYLQLVGVVRAERRLGLTPDNFDPDYDPYQYDEVQLPAPYALAPLSQKLGMRPDLLIAYNPAWTEAVENNFSPVPAGYRLRVPEGSAPIVAQALGIQVPTSTARMDVPGQ